MDEHGASIIEILASVSILTTMIATGVPQTTALWETFEGSKAVKQFVINVRRARIESLTAGTRGVLKVDVDADGFSFGIDAAPYSNPALSDYSVFRENLGESITLNTSDTLIFDSRGFLVDVDGDPTTAAFSISVKGDLFASGTISSSGRVDIN